MVERSYEIHSTPTPCRWSLNPTEPSPHREVPCKPRAKICSSVLEAVGNTPIVRINNITKQENIACELLAKCEYLNPGGSCKDRIGIRMISELELSGELRPGMRIVEATSGNTGVGLALNALVKGYDMTVVMSDKVSYEKSDILTALGVNVIRAPSSAKLLSKESNIGIAEALEKNNEDVIMAGQHFRPSNPLTHYDQTAEEIIDQLDGRLDYIVISSGTGGQITGLSRKLKEKIPGIVVIGVDPKGSIIHDPKNAQYMPYSVEGSGNRIVPRNCYTDLVDQWYVVSDKESFEYARKLIRYEGLLVGGSCGSILFAALQVCKGLGPDKRVLMMLSDGVRDYMSRFLNDRWMVQNGYIKENETPSVEGKKIRDLRLKKVETCSADMTIRQVIQFMNERKSSEVPVLKDGKVFGVASSNFINNKLVSGAAVLDDLIEKAVVTGVKVMDFETSLAFLAIWLEDWKYGIVQDGDFISVVYPLDLTLALSS